MQAPAPRRGLLSALVAERDRLLTLGSLPAFGVWSLIDPTPSLSKLPPGVELGTYCVFLVAGPLLALGAFAGRLAAFVAGHLIVIIGLITVAGVILATSESPVSVLIFGYATALSYSLQKALRERRVLNEIASDTGPLARQEGRPDA